MANVLKILSASGEWHDYTPLIKLRGAGWKRNDIDNAKAGRTKDLHMRRGKLGEKRTCTYSLLQTTRENAAQLDDDLRQETFRAVYADLHGQRESEFYCSEFEATLVVTHDNEDEGGDGDSTTTTELWESKPFNMIEV